MTAGLFSLPLSHLEGVAAPSSSAPGGSPRFVSGGENALVRVVAESIRAANPPYNPLVLVGPSGVGKTCVAQTLAATRREALGLKNVISMSAADLARGLAHALEAGSVADFRGRFHRCDLLLLEDIHRLAEKDAAQQFLQLAIDSLLRRGSLVVATLRGGIGALAASGLSAALVSRLSGGLVVPLAYPEIEARRELIKNFLAEAGVSLSADKIEKLASAGRTRKKPPTSAQALRSQAWRIVVQASALATEPAILPAEPAPADDDVEQSCRQIMSLVARHQGLTVRALRGPSREQSLAHARGLAMHLARQITDASYARIGVCFGNRDHTTVLHACRKVERMLTEDDSLRRLVAQLQSEWERERQ